jgi:hypothetical protein
MHHAALLGKLAGFVSLLALIPYIRSILKGKTKPNRASWFIWAVVSTVLLASYHYSGATTTIWLAATFALIPIIISIFSIKYGVGGYEKLDIVCLVGAVTGLILWKLTSNPQTALYLNIAMDVLGFLPTIKKSYLQPETENTTAWLIALVANIVNVLALTTWQFKIAFYPIYLLFMNFIVALLVTGRLQRLLRLK